MKYLFGLIVFFSCGHMFSQNITGVVFEAGTDTPLPYANITLLTKNRGTTTNENGEFSFEVKTSASDSLLISYMGYASQIIAVRDAIEKQKTRLKIELIENKEQIDAVVLDVKKTKYTGKKKIGENKKKRFRRGTQFGHETCLFIENKKKNIGKLYSLQFYLKENSKSQFKTLPTYYRVKFYEFDNVYKQPGRLLSYRDIIIKPENKTQKIVVNLEKDYILFPIEGICVGIETIKPSGIVMPKNSMYTTAPSLVWTHSRGSHTWGSYRGKKWSKHSRNSMLKKKYFANPLVQLEVQFKK